MCYFTIASYLSAVTRYTTKDQAHRFVKVFYDQVVLLIPRLDLVGKTHQVLPIGHGDLGRDAHLYRAGDGKSVGIALLFFVTTINKREAFWSKSIVFSDGPPLPRRRTDLISGFERGG